MKKNVWENVYYRLNNPVKIRLAILYILNYVDFPVSMAALTHVMLKGTTVDYFDFCEILDTMLKENYIKIVQRDEKNKYDITKAGYEMLEMFGKDLFPSVRAKIRESADKYFADEFKKSQVKCEIMPDDDGTFYVDMVLNEGKKNMLTMSLFAGSRENAIKVKRTFEKDPTCLFKDILTIFNNHSKQNDEE